ncbi:MAG: branched-chain amino acid transport system substrate-binding protein, partial [Actinomycetota bacterium]|nr:branched-chain amino acid transport system substrate-binding protein [Actinomycetota bacterium]
MAEPTVARASKLTFRIAAAVATSLLVAGCGTRLNDSQIEAAAGVGGAGGGGGAASAAAAPGTVDNGGVTDPGAAQPSTGAATASGSAAATPSAGAAAAPIAGGSNASSPGGARTSAGLAAAPTAAQAKGTAGPSAGPAAGNGATTPGAPTAPGAAPAPGAPAAGKAPVIVGNIGDYSGNIGTLMKGGNVMAAVVARYVNEHGGLNGHPMQVVTGDAGGDPARALSLVRDMVENKGVIALMGNLWVFSANGPRQYLEEHKVPVIGG